MDNILKQKDKIGNDIFDEVIIKKNELNISTKQICNSLGIDEDILSDYFFGVTKDNFPLGLRILNYLEEIAEKNNKDWRD